MGRAPKALVVGKETIALPKQKDSLRIGVWVSTILALAIGLLAAPSSTSPAQAVSGNDFNPGNIISDAAFYNGNAMSASEVQGFLNQRVPRCTIGDPGRTAGMPWGSTVIANQCLRDFQMTTTSRAANQYCNAYIGTPNETAAQIIAKVGQACGISQRVLLVMLEKEQSLVTDNWPTVRQFDIAMGYACPDSGPGNSANCDSAYYGFHNQVYRAAWQLKVYRAHPQSFNYRPFQINTIQWHPNPACGTSQVYIENWATAALYIYTPYRPNQAALNAGWGVGDSCSTYGNRNFFLLYNTWFVGESPFGYVDQFTPSNGQLTVAGWALDPDTLGPIDVHIYVGDTLAAALRADQDRPDVAAAYPGRNANHGYSWQAPLDRFVGRQDVCVYALNYPAGDATRLGCASIQFTGIPEQGRAPIGNVDSLSVDSGSLTVRGWTLDPDTASPIAVHVYAGTRLLGYGTADQARWDIGTAYPLYGEHHGFNFQFPTAGLSGAQQVCVYAINSVPGTNPALACRSLDFGGLQERGRIPIGNLDGVTLADGVLNVRGWTLDPDTAAPIVVHAYVGSTLIGYVSADQARGDIAAAYPVYGPNHGFQLSASASAFRGPQDVCVYAINSVPGQNPRLGCMTVDFGGVREQGRAPIGNLDSVTLTDGVLSISGWTLDPDTEAPIEVHVYAGSRLIAAGPASIPRTDVAAAYPLYGADHGFSFTAGTGGLSGNLTVCAYGINSAPGLNPQLGCRAVLVG